MDKSLIVIVVMGIILAGICLFIWKVMFNLRFRPPNMILLNELIERHLK
jgi:hypothetical protein